VNEHPEKWLEAAQEHHLAGRLDEAAALCEDILAADPADGGGHHVLALVRMAQDRLGEAIDHIRQALSAEPENGAFRNSLGLILMTAGDLDGAVTAFRRVIAAAPHFVRAQVNLSRALRRLKRFDEARAVLDRAVALKPSFAAAHFALADLHHEHGDEAAAVVAAGDGRFARGEFEAALDLYRRAAAPRPGDVRVHIALGRTLGRLGRGGEAVDLLRQTLAAHPGNRTVLGTLATVLTGANRVEEALACLDQVATAGKAGVRTHIARAQALLALGRFEDGWAEFEWRLRDTLISQERVRRPFDKPAWDGRRLTGERLFVHTEQGRGDIIQFARYLPLVKERGGHVVFECETDLLALMERTGGHDELVEKSFSADIPYVDHDLHVSLASLPYVFGTTEATIPAAVPYLGADPERIAAWRQRIAGAGLRVGLVWAGNPKHPNDANRSMALSRLAPLAAVEGVSFYALQVGEAATQPAPPGLEVVPLGGEFGDFADAAAAIANLDLVITVDTATAHLAGALGRPVWTLLPYAPDWRWMLDRADSPWYPTMRLYRQPATGDWDRVVERVAADLTVMATARQ